MKVKPSELPLQACSHHLNRHFWLWIASLTWMLPWKNTRHENWDTCQLWDSIHWIQMNRTTRISCEISIFHLNNVLFIEFLMKKYVFWLKKIVHKFELHFFRLLQLRKFSKIDFKSHNSEIWEIIETTLCRFCFILIQDFSKMMKYHERGNFEAN